MLCLSLASIHATKTPIEKQVTPQWQALINLSKIGKIAYTVIKINLITGIDSKDQERLDKLLDYFFPFDEEMYN